MILEKSRKGSLTARIDNKYIHSRYDPEKEALQLADSFISADEYDENKTIIIFEPGLGYILKELSQRHIESNIIVLFFDSECYEFCRSEGLLDNLQSYQPSGNSSIDSFLKETLSNLDIRNILFLELTSTVTLFKDRHEVYQKKILEHLSISQGSEMTKNHFALRWMLNSFKNFIHHDLSGRIHSIDSDIILTASGPSLEEHILDIKKYGSQYIIAALPSSLAILEAYNIIPDILFTTDPGYYAREHLRYLHEKTVIVSSLISSLGSSNTYCCGINQESFAETLLLKDDELPHFPEMGTVAATALFYLMNLTCKKIYVTGLDFCMDDIKMHAQPHSFTPLIIKKENRLEPGHCAFYKRSFSMTHERRGNFRFTKSMNTYSSWFNTRDFGENVFRLTPAVVSLPIKEINKIEPPTTEKNKIQIQKNSNYPSYHERCDRLNRLGVYLDTMIKDFENTNILSPPLAEFIQNVFPSFTLNENKDKLESDSSKNKLLYMMKYLINKTGSMSNG